MRLPQSLLVLASLTFMQPASGKCEDWRQWLMLSSVTAAEGISAEELAAEAENWASTCSVHGHDNRLNDTCARPYNSSGGLVWERTSK